MKLTALFSAALLTGAAALHAQTVNPVPAPTIITTAPYTISAAGYYQLGANLNVSDPTATIITINASNVTLDFAGHYIAGPVGNNSSSIAQTSEVTGVSAIDRNNIIIQNGTIAYCYQGIKLSTPNNQASANNLSSTVQNMSLNYMFRTGVYLTQATNAKVLDCSISNVGGSQYGTLLNTAIELDGGNGNEFSGNSITSAHIGIYSSISSALTFATRNRLSTCDTGIENITKYQDNLTAGVTTSYTGGTDAGGNY